MVGRLSFALERFASPRHSSYVAQLFSLGCYEHPHKTVRQLVDLGANQRSVDSDTFVVALR